jgi:hypothetical protein
MMKFRSTRLLGFLPVGIVALLAFGATAAFGDEQHQKGPTGPTGATGPTGLIAPTAEAAPAPAPPAAPGPAAVAPAPPAPPAPPGPAGEVGQQGGEVGAGGGGGGDVGGGAQEVAQVTPEQQVAAAGEAAPTELATTGSNLVGLALIAGLCLVGAALVFPRKPGKRAAR